MTLLFVVSGLLSFSSFGVLLFIAIRYGKHLPLIWAILFHLVIAYPVFLLTVSIVGNLFALQGGPWMFSTDFGPFFWPIFLWIGMVINTFVVLSYFRANKKAFLLVSIATASLTIAATFFAMDSLWIERKLAICHNQSDENISITACYEILNSGVANDAERAQAHIGLASARKYGVRDDYEGSILELMSAFGVLEKEQPILAAKVAAEIGWIELYKLDRPKEAVTFFSRAIALHDSPSYRYEVSWAHFLSGDHNAAIAAASEAVNALEFGNHRLSARALLRQSLIAAVMGNTELALSSLEDERVLRFLKNESQAFEGYFLIVQVHRRLGNIEKGAQTFQTLVEMISQPRQKTETVLERRSFSKEQEVLRAVLGVEKLVEPDGRLPSGIQSQLLNCFLEDVCFFEIMSAMAEVPSVYPKLSLVVQ